MPLFTQASRGIGADLVARYDAATSPGQGDLDEVASAPRRRSQRRGTPELGVLLILSLKHVLRRWRTDPGRLSFAVLVAGAAFIAAYFLAFDTAAKDLLYQVPGMIAPIAVVAGILRYRPTDPKPWIALAVGLSLTVMGDWTFVILDRMGLELFPSVADALYLERRCLQVIPYRLTPATSAD